MPKGYDIIARDVSYHEQAARFALPQESNCLFAGFFGGSLARAVRNLAPEQPDATVFGAFEEEHINAHYLEMKGAARAIITPHKDTATGTLVCVARATDDFSNGDHSPFFAGTGGTGIVLRPTSGTAMNFSVSNDLGSGGGSGLTVASTTAWRCYIATYGEIIEGTDNLLYDMTGGVNGGSNHGEGAVRAYGQNSVNFGTAQTGTSLKGTCDIAFGAHWSVRLTADERNELYARLKAFFADVAGIAI